MNPDSIRRIVVTNILMQVTDSLSELTEVIEDRALALMTDYPDITEEEIVGIIIKDCVACQDLRYLI